MSSTIDFVQYRPSNPGILGKLSGLFFGGITKKVISDVLKNLRVKNEDDIKLLEVLNAYDGFSDDHIDEIEDFINQRKLLSSILQVFQHELTTSFNRLSEDDKYYNEMILIKNGFSDLIETNKKVHIKLDEIHNRILIMASEKMSSDILDEIWNGEEELWDEFYLESKKV